METWIKNIKWGVLYYLEQQKKRKKKYFLEENVRFHDDITKFQSNVRNIVYKHGYHIVRRT